MLFAMGVGQDFLEGILGMVLIPYKIQKAISRLNATFGSRDCVSIMHRYTDGLVAVLVPRKGAKSLLGQAKKIFRWWRATYTKMYPPGVSMAPVPRPNRRLVSSDISRSATVPRQATYPE